MQDIRKTPHESNTSSPTALAAAAEANLRTGVLLLCKEALVTAIQDKRLERGHLRVLAAIAIHINGKTARAWPERGTIAAITGLSVKTVSNLLLELRNFGYLIADREAVEEAGNRRLTVYTFGNIDHDTIRRHITEFVHALRAKEAQAKVPAHGELQSPRPRGTSPPAGNSETPKVPAHGERKSPPAGDSNSYKELIEEKTRAREEAPPPGVNWTTVLNRQASADDEDAFWAGCKIEVSAVFQAELEQSFPNVDLLGGLAIVAGETTSNVTGTDLKKRIYRKFGYLNNDERGKDRRAAAAKKPQPSRPSRWGG